jgi:hypothetical protein
MFEEEVEDLGFWSWDGWNLFFSRIMIAFIILPTWILLGLVTAGLLWPPEVREFVFVEAIATRLSNHEDESAEQQRLLEVETIQEELENMSDELAEQLATDRANIVQIKTILTDLRFDILGEVKDMKKKMARVIEQKARNSDPQD